MDLLKDQLEILAKKLESISDSALDAAKQSEAYKSLGSGFWKMMQIWKEADRSYRDHIMGIMKVGE